MRDHGGEPGDVVARFACDDRFPWRRTLRLAQHEIAARRLDLGGLRVLTEAAVGYRRLTPVVAALAGADQVYAVGRDSVRASRRDAEAQTGWLAGVAGVQDRIHFLSTRLQAPLHTVDIVTDLPGVRPVDESIVRNLTAGAVVSLMRSTAAWRSTDVDVASCRRAGIAVAGLDEDAVGLYRWTALTAVHGLLELGVEIAGATLGVAGDGAAYGHVVRALSQLGGRVLVVAPESAGRVALYGGEKIGADLADDAVRGRLTEPEALVLCPGEPGRRVIGPRAEIEAAQLAALAPHLAVLCLAGEADRRGLAAAGLTCWPAEGNAAPADLLPQAVVALHTAGLKVGEIMARARQRGSSPPVAEELAAAEAHAELLPKDLVPRR
jgi:hypothetical protein